ncbi:MULTISPECIES: hypothetical protein [unclassified Rhizobium]|uniref:hypothetical protein n=1 Tax=unclassified Rhizobium TaxID=2613769 RepID=UPI001AE5A74F|nr:MULTISPECIES: hypothetical protein [unclassified Rhizobium]MBP2460151.1 capsular polysaccharide transport system permease protein [Rhizobium sp. PvP014]MBP2531510.1 capsular polysaccharide transport system permease protein [Rhizobium sp. PvP099]
MSDKISNLGEDIKVSRLPWARILFLLLTVIPTSAIFFYSLMTTAPLYKSEAQFTVVDRQQNAGANFGGIMASIGIVSGGEPNSMYSLRRFIQSPDALNQLDNSLGFRKYYSAPYGDWLTRLSADANSDEEFDYYSELITLHVSTTESIMTLEVWAFDPEIAQKIAQDLISMSEDFVNRMNNRALEDQVAFRKKELLSAQERLLKARIAVTAWRNANGAVDPMDQVKMIQELINGTEGELTKVRADISQLTAADNAERYRPRISVLQEREASLVRQITNTRERLAGTTGDTVANHLADYERLQVETDFSQKSLEISMAALENARQEAVQKQKYLNLISSPTLPTDRIFPLPGFHTLLVFVTSLLLFGIAMLLHSIIRDYRSV